MDFLKQYDNGSDEEGSENPKKQPKKLLSKPSFKLVNTAPAVDDDLRIDDDLYVDPQSKELVFNPTVDMLWRPIEGPVNPKAKTQLGSEQGRTQNAITGFVEPSEMDNAVFDENYNTFWSRGYAANPDPLAENKIVYGELAQEEEKKKKKTNEELKKKNEKLKAKRLKKKMSKKIKKNLKKTIKRMRLWKQQQQQQQ